MGVGGGPRAGEGGEGCVAVEAVFVLVDAEGWVGPVEVGVVEGEAVEGARLAVALRAVEFGGGQADDYVGEVRPAVVVVVAVVRIRSGHVVS